MYKILLICWAIYSPFWPSDNLMPFTESYNIQEELLEENPFLGRWEGTATTANEKTSVVLDISENNGRIFASISLMDMGVMGWPARSAKMEGKNLILNFPTDNSQQIIKLASYEGSLAGSWQDTRLEEIASISLRRIEQNEAHQIKSIEIRGPEGILSAELITPEGEGPFPGLVFLHGSGPQPKDASRFAAISLAKQGIASVIYDKRGVGASEGEWQGADFKDLAMDGIAVAEYLLSIENIEKVGFFGHSQGGWIGPLASTLWEKATFVISSAGPAVSPAREAEWGFIYNLIQQGGSDEDIQLARKVVAAWHDGLRSGNWESYLQISEEAKAHSWYEPSGLGHLQYPPDPAHMKYYLPFMDYDPIPVLSNLGIPLLSILSPDDESIDSRETETILRQLIKDGKDIRIKLYPGYNHGFRKIGKEGQIRWPGQPVDYFSTQASFIHSIPTGN